MKGKQFVTRAAMALCALVIFAAALAGCGSKNDPNSSSPSNALKGTGKLTIDATGATGSSSKSGGATDPNKTVIQDKGDTNKDTNSISKEPPPVQILTGNNTGVHVNKPTVIVAQTSAQRTALLKRHFGPGVPKDPVSGSNFGSRQLVAIFMPVQPKGTLIVITDVHQEGDHIVVQAVRLTNGQNCKNAGPKPRPFHFVETRKMIVKGPPVLKVETQAASPC